MNKFGNRYLGQFLTESSENIKKPVQIKTDSIVLYNHRVNR